MSATHIAGATIVIGGKYLVQRCSWCGIAIIEHDLEHTAVMGDGKEICRGWEGFVRIEGDGPTMYSGVEVEDGKLPDDFCGFQDKSAGTPKG